MTAPAAQDTAAGWSLRHLPQLDGLRTVAVGLVVAYHVLNGAKGPFRGAFLGVDIFFVLSGFLITSLLIAEHRRSGSVSLRGFYRRRLWRLYPGLVLVCLFVVTVLPFLSEKKGLFAGAAYALTYSASWAFAYDVPQGALGHAWSLSVEEHFYFVWPMVFLLAVRLSGRRRLAVWAGAATLLAAVWPTVLVLIGDPTRDRLYAAPDARGVGLLTGCLLAILLADPKHLAQVRRLLALPGLLSFAVIGLFATSLVLPRKSLEYLLVGQTVVAVATAVVIAHLALVDGRLARVLSQKPWQHLGQWSYGIYLWHLPLIAATTAVVAGRESRVAGALLSVVVAAVSFRYVEQPLLRRYGRRKPAAEPAPAAEPQPAVAT